MAQENLAGSFADKLGLADFLDVHNIPQIALPIAIIFLLCLLFFFWPNSSSDVLLVTNQTPEYEPNTASIKVHISGGLDCSSFSVSLLSSKGQIIRGPIKINGYVVDFESSKAHMAVVSSSESDQEPVTIYDISKEVTVELPDDYCKKQKGTGTLAVSVYDDYARSMIAGTVSIFYLDGSKRASLNTDGKAVFEDLPAGEYYLVASAPGYSDYYGKERSVQVKTAETTSTEIFMTATPPESLFEPEVSELIICVPSDIEGKISVYNVLEEEVMNSQTSNCDSPGPESCCLFELQPNKRYYYALSELPLDCSASGMRGPVFLQAFEQKKFTITPDCTKTGNVAAIVYASEKSVTDNVTIVLYYENGTKISKLSSEGRMTSLFTLPESTRVYFYAKNVPQGYSDTRSEVVSIAPDKPTIVEIELGRGEGQEANDAIVCGETGDLNNDGKIDNLDTDLLSDLISSINHGAPVKDASSLSCADIDQDGKITEYDLICLLENYGQDCTSCISEMQDLKLSADYEICNDGYDNNCDGQTDRDTYDEENKKSYGSKEKPKDLCDCISITPCEMTKDLTGGLDTSESMLAHCAKLSFDKPDSYNWHTDVECNSVRSGQSKECAGYKYVCEFYNGKWQWTIEQEPTQECEILSADWMRQTPIPHYNDPNHNFVSGYDYNYETPTDPIIYPFERTSTPVSGSHLVAYFEALGDCDGTLEFEVLDAAGNELFARNYSRLMYPCKDGYCSIWVLSRIIPESAFDSEGFIRGLTFKVRYGDRTVVPRKPIDVYKKEFYNFFIHGPATQGDLGGLEGADKKCLDAVNALDFKGRHKQQYTQDEVYAFLCDDNTCNNLKPDTDYAFATLGQPDYGGAYFTTDSLGRGPNNEEFWMDLVSTSAENPLKFKSLYYWMGPRFDINMSVWGLEPVNVKYTPEPNNYSCLDWTARGSRIGGKYGISGSSTSDRWGRSNIGCNTYLSLICVVDEDTSTCQPGGCEYSPEDLEVRTSNKCVSDPYGRTYKMTSWPQQNCRDVIVTNELTKKLTQEDADFLNSAELKNGVFPVQKDSRGHFYGTRLYTDPDGMVVQDPVGYSVDQTYALHYEGYSYSRIGEALGIGSMHASQENMTYPFSGSYAGNFLISCGGVMNLMYGVNSIEYIRESYGALFSTTTGLENAPEGAVRFLEAEYYGWTPPPLKNDCYCTVSDYSLYNTGGTSQFDRGSSNDGLSSIHIGFNRYGYSYHGPSTYVTAKEDGTVENYWDTGCYYADGEDSTIHIEGFKGGVATEGTFYCSGKWWVEPYSWSISCSTELQWVDGPKQMDENDLDCWKTGPTIIIRPKDEHLSDLWYYYKIFTRSYEPTPPMEDTYIEVGVDYCERTYTGINNHIEYCGINEQNQPYRERMYCKGQWNLDPCKAKKSCRGGWDQSKASSYLDLSCVSMLGGSELDLTAFDINEQLWGYNNTVEFCGSGLQGDNSHVLLQCDGLWAIEPTTGEYYCEFDWSREEYSAGSGC